MREKQLGQGAPTPPTRLILNKFTHTRMKFPFKGNKQKRKFLLAGLLLALEVVASHLKPEAKASASPATFRIEASYEAKAGAHLLIDKH